MDSVGNLGWSGAMTAFPPVLISILQPCLQLKATHVEVSDEHVVLFKGENNRRSSSAWDDMVCRSLSQSYNPRGRGFFYCHSAR